MLTIIGKANRWTVALPGPSGMPALVAGRDERKDKAGQPRRSPQKVSYDKQIRPIFQARCQGCHQPAKAGGGYVMTTFDRLLKGGESDEPAIVPGKPGESHLVEQITPQGRQGRDAPEQASLSAGEIELITRWIAQGASRRHASELPRPATIWIIRPNTPGCP